MSELLTLEADIARMEAAIYCIEQCDPDSFASFGERDDGQHRRLASQLRIVKQGMEKKVRQINHSQA